jgi:hypothetical protein
VHRVCSLVFLAGCDLALGLDRPGHDDDMDGAPDDEDGCPHIPNQSTVDADGDGISVDCDIDDSATTTNRIFWTFLDGQRPAELTLVGGSAIADRDGEAIVFGQKSDSNGALVLDVQTDTALIDVGFEVLDNAIDDEASSGVPYVELGLHTVHRAFAEDLKERGDTCFFGRNPQPAAGYLELNEDEESRGSPPHFDGPLTGISGRMRQKRTPARTDCLLVQASGLQSSNGFDVEDRGRTGKIAISSDRVRARIRYVWITYQK